MKKLNLVITMLMFVAVSVFSQNHQTASVVSYDFNKKERVVHCEVEYYVNNGKLYVNNQFSYLGVIYLNNMGKYVAEKSIIFKRDWNGWFSVNLKKRGYDIPTNCYIGGLVLRNMKIGTGVQQCRDSYLYNNSNGYVPVWRGPKNLNETTQEIVTLLNK